MTRRSLVALLLAPLGGTQPSREHCPLGHTNRPDPLGKLAVGRGDPYFPGIIGEILSVDVYRCRVCGVLYALDTVTKEP